MTKGTKPSRLSFASSRYQIAPLALPLAITLLLAVFAGERAAAGKLTHIIPIYIILSIPLLASMSRDWLFRIFLSLPLVSLLVMPSFHLPLGIPPVLAVMGGLAAVQLITQAKQFGLSLHRLIEFLPLSILMVGALITALRTNELQRWFVFPLPLVFWIYLSQSLLRSPKDAMRVVRGLFVAILVYLCLVFLMKSTEHVAVIKSSFADWRLFGNGEILSLGPIEYRIFSIQFGAIVGFGSIVALFLFLDPLQPIFARGIYLVCILIFAIILGLTAARGATIAAVFGMGILILSTGKRRFTGPMILAGVGIVIVLFQSTILNLLPPETVLRFNEIENSLAGVRTLDYRIRILQLTVQQFHLHPFGAGYGYLWENYGLDESIIYSSILNGTGIIGAVGFMLWMIQLLIQYLRSLIPSGEEMKKNWAIFGFSIWLFTCLNGTSSSGILLDPIHSFLMWGALITAYQANRLSPVRQFIMGSKEQ
jgi:hypothetical protein